MVQGLWIGAMILVGWLASLRRGWRRQAADAGVCAAALALAWWQYPRMVPHVRAVWPALSVAAGPGPGAARGAGLAAGQVALVYLFVALYGLSHVLVSLYVPDRREPGDKRWLAGLIGAGQAGALATLAMVLLPVAGR